MNYCISKYSNETTSCAPKLQQSVELPYVNIYIDDSIVSDATALLEKGSLTGIWTKFSTFMLTH